MESIFEHIKTFCLTKGLDKTYWVAYSGGLDSHVLLHVCAEIRKTYPLSIRAIHINHQLSPHAASWAAHCAKTCHDLQISFLQKTVHVMTVNGESPEEIARDARYSVFSEVLSTNDYLLTAHQQDDQAETVLLQLLRGAGPKGLSAMPWVKSFAAGFHARPLLEFSRADLQKYAEAHQLSWIDDESNLNVGFARNFLRHEVLPILKKRWPSVTKTLSRVANHCAEAQSILDVSALEDLKTITEEDASDRCSVFGSHLSSTKISAEKHISGLHSSVTNDSTSEDLTTKVRFKEDRIAKFHIMEDHREIRTHTETSVWLNKTGMMNVKICPLNITKLLQLSFERQRLVLREWIYQAGMPLPSVAKMQQIQEYFLQSGHDKSPHIIWSDVELRRFQNKLYLMKCLTEHDPTQVYSWDMQKPLMLNGDRILHATLMQGVGLRTDIPQIEIRFRQGGERCRLPGRKLHHDLKKLFQQWKVPPWQRERIPLLYVDDKLIGVVGFFIDEEYSVNQSGRGYLIQCVIG